jgi:predicted DNA-binding ribbon-helix-helix protein
MTKSILKVIERITNMTTKGPLRGFRIPDELYAEVQEEAARQDLTVAQVVRRLLAEWLRDSKAERG